MEKSVNTFKFVDFPTRVDAARILNNAKDVCAAYGYVSLADVKDLAGLTCDYFEHKLRWSMTDLNATEIIRLPSGSYRIKFPEPTEYNPFCTEMVQSEDHAEDTETIECIEPIHVTIHTNLVDDPASVIAEVFKYAYTIKDRVVNIVIQ